MNRHLQDNLSGDRSVPCQPEDELDKVCSVHQVLYSMRDKFSCKDDSLMGFSDKKSQEHDCPLLDHDFQERHSAQDDSPSRLEIDDDDDFFSKRYNLSPSSRASQGKSSHRAALFDSSEGCHGHSM